MEHLDSDTIAALSTPMGRGGIAVIRISGPLTLSVLKGIIKEWPDSPTPRRAYHSYVTDGEHSIDECVVLYFKGPHSYTGEDVAEISIHSNPFLVEEVLNVIYNSCPSAPVRTAMAGEFTFRAFKNGKMDLIQAESVQQLIDANSRYYAHMSFGALEGRLSTIMHQLKKELVQLGVLIETKIEFEEDQFFDKITISRQLDAPIKSLETILANSRFNQLLNKGLNVVILGKVNVGKSSLFNTLLMEERSIISNIPGTTRDFIREKLHIEGFPIEITDVAGINRETSDTIEAIGIKRSLEQLESCDAAIFMLDGSQPLDGTDKDIYGRVKDKNKLVIVNKLDRPNQKLPLDIADFFQGETIAGISVKEHINIEAVTGFLKQLIITVREKETEFTVNRRQRQILEQLQEVLTRIRKMVEAHTAEAEIVAEELRVAINLIGQLMGEITPDDILHQIFSEFCVGK